MNCRPRLLIAAAALAALGTGTASLPATARAATALAPPSASMPAPDFSLAGPKASKVSLAQFRGQVVMLNFWATWCGPCRQEMPLLEAMYKKYKPMGFTLIGVNVEPDSKAAEAFLQKLPVSFPVAFDTDSAVSKLYKVQGMPSTVIIDRKGNARVLHKGYRPGDENEYLDYIRTLIREN
ncbi:MAG: TlpA disulfide reductase family protein [Planctomycetota bacterium]